MVFFLVVAVLVLDALVTVDFVEVFLVVVFLVALEAAFVFLLVLLPDLLANIDRAASKVSPSTVCSLVSDTFTFPCLT